MTPLSRQRCHRGHRGARKGEDDDAVGANIIAPPARLARQVSTKVPEQTDVPWRRKAGRQDGNSHEDVQKRRLANRVPQKPGPEPIDDRVYRDEVPTPIAQETAAR